MNNSITDSVEKKPEQVSFEVQPNALRPVAFHVFTRKYDLNINRDSLQELASFVSKKCGSQWRSQCEPLLDEIAKTWKRVHETQPIVTRPLLIPVLANLNVPHEVRVSSLARVQTLETTGSFLNSSNSEIRETIKNEKYFRVLDAFKMPKFKYDSSRKVFVLSKQSPTLMASASACTDMLNRRFNVVYSRILRNESFQTPSFSGSFSQTGTYQLTPIRNLLGRAGNTFLLFGLLTIAPDGTLWLEDLDSQVQLDVSQAEQGFGLFCPGCLVLVNGQFLSSGLFLVFELGHPPIERRDASLKALNNLDILGLNMDAKQLALLRHAEQAYQSQAFVCISEVHLDNHQTFYALEKIFQKYESSEAVPFCIILCGSFMSSAFHNSGSSIQYKEGFNKLAASLEKFPKICEKTKFIFVPGPNDPWTTNGISLMPKHSIPLHFVNRIQRVCKHTIFASNPCRIIFFSQEVLIYRDDISGRFQRNSLKFGKTPQGTSNINSIPLAEQQVHQQRKLVKTVLDQSHLSPFPSRTRPILWDFDYALSVFPLPSCMGLIDSESSAFDVHYGGCPTFNPGALLLGVHYNWQEVFPVKKEIITHKERI
ncbi:DNA polymerase epsilon catalytic subunit B, Dpb2 [Schizosaccharomyces pombe]|uniref:DNA polymerase epsilon subunit B n=1 Tax=Schizosaccharomyces pombe (strain 972 / ATCC 24843) TaxID=284812 RepID=DPB2_SCHPO|nr:DNA polymerase epsilon catalytic subunit B Dpb2 [Schizosaccharomyces pombe]O94263.1 RecName: Full=DNA polymerase epsilon subunit B; AltName: Full=DNA polymerase II subunit 2 [Schizosaccharomyces pombe 972h-]CAA21799.1 DNA polymerase epsilon catalytic subunit B, Dpb2 [Schizosaccharomyces pombe]|eukprot:NP_596521.1 DNA polymerase epsilon catalytic subunit B Dpb2 [Schizosaccharomyces pombe]